MTGCVFFSAETDGIPNRSQCRGVHLHRECGSLAEGSPKGTMHFYARFKRLLAA